MDRFHTLLIIAVIAPVTAFTRFAPFLIFRGRIPKPIEYLGAVLPCAVIAMLVVYCVKGVSFASLAGYAPAAIAILITALLHKWRHSTLLSVFVGTVSYMLLIRFLG